MNLWHNLSSQNGIIFGAQELYCKIHIYFPMASYVTSCNIVKDAVQVARKYINLYSVLDFVILKYGYTCAHKHTWYIVLMSLRTYNKKIIRNPPFQIRYFIEHPFCCINSCLALKHANLLAKSYYRDKVLERSRNRILVKNGVNSNWQII